MNLFILVAEGSRENGSIICSIQKMEGAHDKDTESDFS